MTQVILVNTDNEAIGLMDKMEAHEKGVLHRAFSVFIFNKEGDMLLQQRAEEKYHGGLLWTNACCSHPLPGEDIEEAAHRRLQEELGIQTSLQEIFSFQYYAPVENNLIENEYDHVFAGEYTGTIKPDLAEVKSFKYENMNTVEMDLHSYPAKYTRWFAIAFPQVKQWWNYKYGIHRTDSH